jgi:hypothetical protein
VRRISGSFPYYGEEEDSDAELDEKVCCSFGKGWTMPEWIDSLTYRRVARIGGHDFISMEIIVAVLVVLVSGILVKLVVSG